MGTTTIMTIPLLFKEIPSCCFLSYFLFLLIHLLFPDYRESEELCSGQCFPGLAHRHRGLERFPSQGREDK